MANKIVDIHTHIYPRRYLDTLAARNEVPRIEVRDDNEYFQIFPEDAGRVIDRSFWSLADKIAYMDRAGISQSIVSLGNPWLELFTGTEGVTLARALNEEFASFEQQTKSRVLGMGCLPHGPVDDVVKIVSEIANTQGLYGIVSGTQLCGFSFDDSRLDPVWKALAENAIPLLVHPHPGLGFEQMNGIGHALPLALGFPFETTTAMAKLTMSGVLDRYPDLAIIASHGGGAIPYLAGRLDGCWAPDEKAKALRMRAPSEALERLYLDALVYHPRSLRAAADLVGPQKLVFGTDHPFSIANPEASIVAIEESFDSKDAKDVLGLNAQRIFGLKGHG